MITSVSNQKIKQIVKLQKSGKARRDTNLFVVEGIRMVREIPKDRLEKVYVTEEWKDDLPDDWEEGLHYEYVTQTVFQEISDTRTPQGILAVVRQQSYCREDLLGLRTAKTTPCLLLLEHIQDPGNLGTIMRTAEGAGITGIMMSKDTVDIYNSKTVRATMGAIFRMPFCYEEDLQDAVAWLKQQKIVCYAAQLNGSCFYDCDYRNGCCFMIGNEGNGLTETIARMADVRIRIPMKGKVESLNAATAAAVLSYEVMRQRYI